MYTDIMFVWCAVPAVAEMSTFNFRQFVLLYCSLTRNCFPDFGNFDPEICIMASLCPN